MQLNEDLSNEDLRNLYIAIYKECYRRANKTVDIIEAKNCQWSGTNYPTEITTWAKEHISDLKEISGVIHIQPFGLLASDYTPYTENYNTIIVDKIGNCFIANVVKYSLEVLIAKNRISELEEEIKSIKNKFSLIC